MSSQKLWVAYETSGTTFGPTRVSIDGCQYVDDFKGIRGNKTDFIVAIRNNPELAIPSKTPITLYQRKDGNQVEIKAGDSPANYLEGNSRGNPLIVRSKPIAKGILI